MAQKPFDFTIPIWYNIGVVKDKVCNYSSRCGARPSEFLLDCLVYYKVCFYRLCLRFIADAMQLSILSRDCFPFLRSSAYPVVLQLVFRNFSTYLVLNRC